MLGVYVCELGVMVGASVCGRVICDAPVLLQSTAVDLNAVSPDHMTIDVNDGRLISVRDCCRAAHLIFSFSLSPSAERGRLAGRRGHRQDCLPNAAGRQCHPDGRQGVGKGASISAALSVLTGAHFSAGRLQELDRVVSQLSGGRHRVPGAHILREEAEMKLRVAAAFFTSCGGPFQGRHPTANLCSLLFLLQCPFHLVRLSASICAAV